MRQVLQLQIIPIILIVKKTIVVFIEIKTNWYIVTANILAVLNKQSFKRCCLKATSIIFIT